MVGAANSRNRILRHCGKIHSEIDEEPNVKGARQELLFFDSAL
jgi:hypothetical protein